MPMPFGPLESRPEAMSSNSTSSPRLTIRRSSVEDHPEGNTSLTEEEKQARLEKAVREILSVLEADPDREGLKRTPKRVAESLLFLTKGYTESAEETFNGAVFEEGNDNMVVVRDVDFFSLCEHHLLPFTGKVHIGYVPNGRVLGLSKLARLAEVYSRRLQVQERMTLQISEDLMKTLQPLGVAVVIEATHHCMCMRGVQKIGSSTVTSSMLGVFRNDERTRKEFLGFIGLQR